jgi:hypothetical protein
MQAKLARTRYRGEPPAAYAVCTRGAADSAAGGRVSYQAWFVPHCGQPTEVDTAAVNA